MDDRQLKWVQRARVGRESDTPVGSIARDFVQSLGRGGPAWRQELIGILYDEIGIPLLEFAEPTSIRRGVLTFHVNEPAMACHLRIQWEQPLLQLLTSRLPQAGIHTIRFAAGGAAK